MGGISRKTSVLIFVTLCTLSLIHSTSGVMCYSCSGRGEGIQGRCQNFKTEETYNDWKEINCSHTGFNTCAHYFHRINGETHVNLTYGCGTKPKSGEKSCDHNRSKTTEELTELCHCEGDLCNWSGHNAPILHCHLCGGSYKKKCPDDYHQLNSTDWEECTVGGPKALGHRRANGVCQSIRTPVTGKYILACIPHNTPESRATLGKCREEKEGKVCYCNGNQCIPDGIKRKPQKDLGNVLASLSFLQLMLVLSAIYFIVGTTISVGY